ncbi:MAG: hypothetical protein Q4P20_04225 [Eubacteriales bacterium]|nr:hypothetical protein [Eubacteriales bacterium]
MILFVDINDVCRAPLAAELYRRTHDADAHSAGVYADEGAALCDAVRPALLDGHVSRQLSASMLEKADAVWCVTAAIARHLAEEYPQHAHKIHAMQEIDDPAGMGRGAYEACARRIRTQVEGMA